MRNFLVLWLGQSVSSLGSSMTGFAITIWAFQKTESALVLSISSLLIMVPKMVVGVLAGPFVDRANKKAVMICTDIGAGLCTLVLFVLLWNDALEIWHIYVLNIMNSVLGSFQTPAASVAVSAVVPKEHYVRANGMQSFSEGIIQILAPVFAAALHGFVGMTGVIIIDFITMVFACLTLAYFVKIPKHEQENRPKFNMHSYFDEWMHGLNVIRSSHLLRTLMLFMVFINFVAGLTYYNLLSPMVLARTANDSRALAVVNGAVGLGSVAGALLVFFLPTGKHRIKTMFLCTGLSFLLGDVMLAVGSTLVIWVIAGFFSGVFLPAFNANESYFWRTIIPIEVQGRAFSFKYALQSGVIPVGLLLGGVLADYVFEPYMAEPHHLLSLVLGSGKGSGMALMFLITGMTGMGISIAGVCSRSLKRAEDKTVLEMQRR